MIGRDVFSTQNIIVVFFLVCLPHSALLCSAQTSPPALPVKTTETVNASGRQTWLTGQGGMASLDTAPPSLNWHPAPLQPLAIIVSLIGIVLGLLG